MDNNEFGNSTVTSPNNIERSGFSKTTSRIIIALLILSAICGFVPSFVAVYGIVIGGIVLIISIYRRKVKYYGYAAAAIVAFCTMSFLFFALVIVPNSRARAEREKANTACYNLKVLGTSIDKYVKAHNGCLPPADSWCEQLMEFDKTLTQENFKHPKIEGSVIAFNKNIGGMRIKDIPNDTIMLFEASGGWNLTGGEEIILTKNGNRYFVDILLVGTGVQLRSYSIKEKGINCWRGRCPARWKL